MSSDSEQSSPFKTPLQVDFSETNFAVFGDLNRVNTVYIKSRNASIELLGSRPVENVDSAKGSHDNYLAAVVMGLPRRPLNWVASLPLIQTPESPGIGRLIFVWEGLCGDADRDKVRNTLDQSAADISSAALRGDLWNAVLAISPLIFQCRVAHRKNEWRQGLIWSGALLAVLLLLAFAFCRPEAISRRAAALASWTGASRSFPSPAILPSERPPSERPRVSG